MRTRRLMASLVAGAVAVTVIGWGCNKQQSAKGTDNAATQASAVEGARTIGVVNYEKVLRDVGWYNKLQSDLQNAQNNLNKELSDTLSHYEQQLTGVARATVKDWDKLKPDQQRQVLSRVAVQLQPVVAQLQQQAREKFNSYSNEWLRRYKEGLAPIVRQVAQQRRIAVVLQQTDTVVFLDPSVDLTNAVVDGAKAQPPVITDVAMPVLNAPTITTNGATTIPATFPTTAPASVPATRP